jgi:hypothetical protein
MTTEHSQEPLVNLLSPEAQEEFSLLMNEHHLGRYEKTFLLNFSKARRLKRLFFYGMAQLPNDEYRPNLELATYFYLLSEITNLKPEVKALAAEAMTYCENESGMPTWSLTALKAEYKKIKPLLE